MVKFANVIAAACGFGMLLYGFYSIHPPLAWIIGGVLFVMASAPEKKEVPK